MSRAEAPYQPGSTLTITYLPEDPSMSRPITDRSRATQEAASNRDFTRKVLWGVFGFFALNAAMSELKLRKLRERVGPGGDPAPLLSPVWLGRIVGALLIGLAISVNFGTDVSEVQQKSFGTSLLGMPTVVFVSLFELVLFAPFIWVFEHLMQLTVQAMKEGASLSKAGLLRYMLFADDSRPELRRSRRVVLAGFGYFVVLVGSWIAFAAVRGV